MWSIFVNKISYLCMYIYTYKLTNKHIYLDIYIPGYNVDAALSIKSLCYG